MRALAGIFVPFLAFFAACLALAGALLFALLFVRSTASRPWLFPALIAVVAVVVAIAQPLGLKVLALPKADDLTF